MDSVNDIGLHPPSYFTPSHAGLLVQLLFKCEQVMVVSYEQCPVPVPAQKCMQEQKPSRSDPLEILYRIDPVAANSHSRIVLLGLDLTALHPLVSADQKDVVLARALCYRVDQASELARLRSDQFTR